VRTSLWSAFALVIAVLTLLSSGCVASGGYGYDDGAGYYQVYGANYGGWGPHYYPGPVREDGHPDEHGGGHPEEHGGAPPPQHAERSAPPPRSVPSIPSGSHPGGESHH
jgi:hypothetical protein